MKISKLIGNAMLGTCLYGAVVNSFPTNEEKDAVGEIDATNEVERAGCAAALGLKTTIGLTQGEIVAAIRGVGGESVDGRVEVKNVESGREGLESAAGETRRGTVLGRSQWGIRGAWDDDYYQAFGTNWVFPFGTNHLSGVVVYSQGGLAASSYDEPFVALPVPVAIVPREGSFTVEQTSSNSTVFAWWNVRPGRTATETLDAQIELFRNGDYCVSTNGVVVERYIRGNPYPDVPIGQDNDYRDWVDDQVGVGLTNGLYKFTASFPVDPIEFTLLRVGEESVVVTNAGEYVFVLEKGREYEFETVPYDPTVEYDMCDDIAPLARMRLMGWWEDDSSSAEWSIGGGENWLNYPGMYWWGYSPGWCCWMPTLQGSPGFTHLGPDDFPITLEAILTDYCGSETPSFQWSGSNDNVTFSNPNAQTTELNCDNLPSWDSLFLSVEANLGGYSMWSYLAPHYGQNSKPQIFVSLDAPEVVVRYDAKVNCRKLRPMTFSFSSDIETNGTLCLKCVSGGQRIRMWEDAERTVSIEGLYRSAIIDSSSYQFTAYVEGVQESETCDDVALVAEFVADTGVMTCVSNKMTVVSIAHETVSMTPIDRERVDLGVGEEVVFYIYPENALMRMISSSGSLGEPAYGHKSFTAPGTGTVSTVSLSFRDLQVDVDFYVFEPVGYYVKGIVAEFGDVLGEAGLITLNFDNKIIPADVSFYAIEVLEIPMVATNAVGYFAEPERRDDLDHGQRGAGLWTAVDYDNSSVDRVQAGYWRKPWNGGGSYTWPIPNAWRLAGDVATTNVFSQNDQRFELDSNGTARVYKFGYMGERTTNNQHRVEKRVMP